jgi:16S rRNA (guanine527-N7)-methyltransferase
VVGDDHGLVEFFSSRLTDPNAALQMVAYVHLLENWSSTHSLVRFSSRDELLRRHVVEPLEFAASLPPQGRLLDVGSGAGLPGVPLLIAKAGWSGVLLEPRHKRWTFLRLVIRELGIDAEAVAERYQDYTHMGPFDLVTVRALGGYAALAGWCKARLGRQGRLVVWTTEGGAQELAALPGWRVLSSAVAGLDRGLVLQLQPCFT